VTRSEVVVEVPDAEAMRDLGSRLARACRAGDIVVLDGPLGAGKTTFTQGLAVGLGVAGPVTSPTFVIARVHRVAQGPDLVHVDAYRLGGLAELDDLDLDASVADSITVVEWGEGVAERLGEQVVAVHIARDVSESSERRTVRIRMPEGRELPHAADR
jgi:tRNA threonylcarbamoyladenosine biosynthesis protein TsaE